MLMYASALDNHDLARLPVDAPAVVNIVAATLEHVKAGTVQMAVLLAVGARGIDLDMRLDRLHDGRRLRADDVLAVQRRPALPRQIARGEYARLVDQGFVEIAV